MRKMKGGTPGHKIILDGGGLELSPCKEGHLHLREKPLSVKLEHGAYYPGDEGRVFIKDEGGSSGSSSGATSEAYLSNWDRLFGKSSAN